MKRNFKRSKVRSKLASKNLLHAAVVSTRHEVGRPTMQHDAHRNLSRLKQRAIVRAEREDR